MPDNDDEKKIRVFVYGTLMRGGRNSHLLEGSTLIDADAMTRNNSFLMEEFESSSSPGKKTPGVRLAGNYYIKGELHEVGLEQLAKLDALEGFDPLKKKSENKYLRVLVELQGDIEAFMYVMNAPKIAVTSDKSGRAILDEQGQYFYWDRREPSLSL